MSVESKLASEHGMQLLEYKDGHCILKHLKDRWRLVLYPEQQLIQRDPNFPRAPYPRMGKGPWTVLDVIRTVIAEK